MFLKENITQYQAKVLISVSKDFDRGDIFDNIRAIPNVIIVKPKDSDYLNSKETDEIGFSFLFIRFTGSSNAVNELKRIKKLALRGGFDFKPVEGLLSFKYNPANIKRAE